MMGFWYGEGHRTLLVSLEEIGQLRKKSGLSNTIDQSISWK